MRNLKVELVAFHDEPTGELGLKVAAVTNHPEMYAAREGRLIAHDILEHVNGPEEIGDVGDELEALGAIWYIRGRNCDLSRDGTGSAYGPHENVASDVAEMLRKCICDPSEFPALGKRTQGHDMDDDFHEIINYGQKSARAELRACEQTFKQSDVERFCRVTLSRMRTGYRKAERKYKNVDANGAFWNIAEVVTKAAKHIEYDGQRFEVRYNWDTGRASCDETYSEDNY